MDDVVTTSATPAPAATAVNLTTLGSSSVPVEAEIPIDFTPLARLVRSLYIGNYSDFFLALAAVEENFLSQDRYLYEHRGWFVREMRLRAYQQLLQSYRVVGLSNMAASFGISIDFLDKYALPQPPPFSPCHLYVVDANMIIHTKKRSLQIHCRRSDPLHNRSREQYHRDEPSRRQEQAVYGRGQARGWLDYQVAKVWPGRKVTG